MPPTADWLVPALLQFPIAALILGFVWLVVKWLDRRHREEVLGLRADVEKAWERANAEIARCREDHAAERARTAESHDAQLRQLRARIRELERRDVEGRP